MHAEKDAHIWKSPEIDRAEQEEIKKYTTKDHKVNMDLIICSYVLLKQEKSEKSLNCTELFLNLVIIGRILYTYSGYI